jgi:serine/threonine-protein kinase
MSLIGTRVGNYEIKEKLGEGGMGAVYMGEHPLIGKRVAVKVLLDELTANEALVTRFFHEAKAANDIRHQNIVDIIDFGKLEKEGGGKLVYLVMELLEGRSLSSRLDTAPRLTFDDVRHVLQQCCSGLAASHAKGIIHRDLKPDNLFLVRRGSDDNFVKILDFGIAKLTVTSSTNAKTRTGTLIGTPAYMSPEQCAGRGNIDARSDVYSLGIVMYEMLTGTVPFKGEGFGDIVVAQLTETAKKPSELRADVPPELDAIVMKAIEKDTSARFQSMDEFGIALKDPEKFARSPSAVAEAGAVAAAPTAAVAVINDVPSGPKAASITDQATLIATKPKANTTLSEAASESAVREPAAPAKTGNGRRIAIIGGLAATVAAAAIVAVLKLGGSGTVAQATVTPPPVTPPPVAAVAPPKIEEVEVALKSDPPGAQVVRSDGVVVGVTPVTMKLEKGSPSLDVQLSLDGYRAEKRTLTSDVNREVDVNLLKAATPPPTKHAGKAVAAKPSETKSPSTKPAESKPAETKPAKNEKPADPDKDLIPAQL